MRLNWPTTTSPMAAVMARPDSVVTMIAVTIFTDRVASHSTASIEPTMAKAMPSALWASEANSSSLSGARPGQPHGDAIAPE